MKCMSSPMRGLDVHRACMARPTHPTARSWANFGLFFLSFLARSCEMHLNLSQLALQSSLHATNAHFFVFGYRGPYYFSSRLMSINHAKKEPYKSLYPGTCFICKMSKYLCSCTIFLRAIFFGSPRKKFPHGKGAW